MTVHIVQSEAIDTSIMTQEPQSNCFNGYRCTSGSVTLNPPTTAELRMSRRDEQ